MRNYIPPHAKLLPPEAKRVFRGVIWEVYQWPQKMFDGSVETFEMMRRPDTVKTIAVVTAEEARKLSEHHIVTLTPKAASSDGPKIIITKQEQPRKDSFYDYPGGRHDHEAEDELAAAKRELLEETGLKMRNWKLIKVKQPFNKIDWLVYTFLATEVEGWKEQSLDAGEKIETIAMDFDELHELKNARYLDEDFDSYNKLMAAPSVSSSTNQ